MIWNQVELFNVSQIRQQEDSALQFFRFPDTVLEQFKSNEISNTSGRTTTGCEIRFVGNAADITLSADMGVDTYEMGGSCLCEKEVADYICCLENLCEKLKCENLYYIRGREIVTDLGMLSADLLHPTYLCIYNSSKT